MLDRFKKYRIGFFVKEEKYFYSYKKQGANPLGIFSPEVVPKVTYINESRNDFLIDLDVEYVWKTSEWVNYHLIESGNDTYTKYRVSSTTDDYPILGEIPEEFKEKFPNLDLADMQYSNSRFYLKSEPYETYMFNNYMNSKIRRLQEWEEEFITIYKEE